MNDVDDAVKINEFSPAVENLFRRAAIVIPTYNAHLYWNAMQSALEQQRVQADQVLIVDSSSTDDTRKLAKQAGYQLKTIAHESFRHGATRQLAAEYLAGADILVYLTQDALPYGPDAFRHLLTPFLQSEVGACYGRQLPRLKADPIERHARLFNYPNESALRTFDSRRQLGFRAAFFSNSFAAYRRSALMEVGGFPRDTIVSEEVTVAARMLMADWNLAYQAEATAIHSHRFTLQQEFSRYFDIGVHHQRENWLLNEFGGAGGEGRKFILSEARYLMNHQWSLLPKAALRNVNKWVGYQLGRHEHLLPQGMKEKLSAQTHYWADERTSKLMAQSQPVVPSSSN
jgi:rhamnosyltransferase